MWDGSVSLKRNEFLKEAGTKDTNLYFVVSGTIKMSIFNKHEEHVVRFGYKNSFIASMDSFLSGSTSDFCLQAIKKVELKFITKKNHSKLISQSIENQSLWNKILELIVIQQLEHEKDILLSSPKERFLKVFNRSPNLFQEIPNKHIASYLRMTPETLSRLKKVLI